MTDYKIPVLSESQKSYEIEMCKSEIERLEITLKNGSSDTPHHVESALNRQKIALAALTAKPIDQLEAAQREGQEFAKLAGQNAARAEAAEAERDEAIMLRLEVSGALSSETIRREKAEAELKRRDAQEPVADVVLWEHPTEERKCDIRWRRHDVQPGPLYTAATAAVLPPEICTTQAIHRLEVEDSPGTVNVAYKWGYNQAIADAKAMGCQPEKVVKLPGLCVGIVQDGHAVMVPYAAGHWFNKTAILEALAVAGVKVEGE